MKMKRAIRKGEERRERRERRKTKLRKGGAYRIGEKETKGGEREK